ncbi:MAG TPA: class I SAM-dependent methyltransferase [Candidatus Binatia bacterium]|jgi:2-polyprenyl-3-methyl-5-hydroxy-6-metoxy-1,4-benzoquinol methylase|nr:class I SAM-dependent methyltransferase [Candidatus Binatia bacterium]
MFDSTVGATRCPVCGAANTRFLSRGYYSKCPRCKVAFREQEETSAELAQYWQSAFWTAEEIGRRKDREPVFRQAFSILRELKPEGGSVLDIGCGIGTFLAVCRDEGWHVKGVEPSSIACEVAKREYGLELINESFSSEIFQDEKFDAVFAAQVLHHLPDPLTFLVDVDRVLADDGVLILRTPNLIPLELSLFAQRLLGRKRQFFCGPALYTFHPETLSLLFKRLNYGEIQAVNSRPYVELPGAPWQKERSVAANLKRLLIAGIKLSTHGAVQAAYTLSRGNLVIGPSIFVVARKG